MNPKTMQAAAHLQATGWTVVPSADGFVATSQYAGLWIVATERKTIMGDESRKVEVRKLASVEVLSGLQQQLTAGQATIEPWQARAVLKAALDTEPAPATG